MEGTAVLIDGYKISQRKNRIGRVRPIEIGLQRKNDRLVACNGDIDFRREICLLHGNSIAADSFLIGVKRIFTFHPHTDNSFIAVRNQMPRRLFRSLVVTADDTRNRGVEDRAVECDDRD